jgi:hypothetical protein
MPLLAMNHEDTKAQRAKGVITVSITDFSSLKLCGRLGGSPILKH